MSKKEALIPFAFLALSILFIAVCVMVYLSKGKSKKWVARKMWIGGLLLNLSCNPGTNYHTIEMTTCYIVVSDEDNRIETNMEKIETNMDSNHIIYGYISGYWGKDFSYTIIDKKGMVIQEENVYPKAWSPDNERKEFVLDLVPNVGTGKYLFKLYDCPLKEQDSTYLIHEYQFSIK